MQRADRKQMHAPRVAFTGTTAARPGISETWNVEIWIVGGALCPDTRPGGERRPYTKQSGRKAPPTFLAARSCVSLQLAARRMRHDRLGQAKLEFAHKASARWCRFTRKNVPFCESGAPKQKSHLLAQVAFSEMVGTERFELSTSCSRSKRSTRLSYVPSSKSTGGTGGAVNGWERVGSCKQNLGRISGRFLLETALHAGWKRRGVPVLPQLPFHPWQHSEFARSLA